MIDLKDLREQPERYRKGAADKQMTVDIDALLKHDADLRQALAERETLAAEKNQIGKQIGQLAGQMKKASDDERPKLQQQMKQLQQRPNEIKKREAELERIIGESQQQRDAIWLTIPQPADSDVPVGGSEADNTEIRRWNPEHFNPARSFEENRGFKPKSHIDLMLNLGMVNFERGVNIAGSRSYVLTGDGMRLHQAILRCAFDYMIQENGFTPMSVPVIVREPAMVGTGFFPTMKDQAYEIKETQRGGGHDLYLTGTGEVGLMAYHMDEILDKAQLPRCYTTMSTCFRREAGAAGRDTAGLFRIHQFDKVEQVVICEASEQVSRQWHQKMIGYVETLMQRLELPYRLLQCCTGDLGPKNVDQIDIECWMPSRGEPGDDGTPPGAYAETHSASRLYDYQCRRLNIRYRDPDQKGNVVAHALNNTVAASPRILIPIVEMYQNSDGSIRIPKLLQPYMAGRETIG